MAIRSFLAIAAALVAQSAAAPFQLPNLADLPNIALGDLHLKEAIQTPLRWIESGAAHPDTTLRLQIALKHQDISSLQSRLLDISHPASANYGQWLSKDELEQLTAPAEGAADAVLKWLTDAGVSAASLSQPSPDWVEAVVNVSHAESLLGAKYRLFEHASLPFPVPRTLAYSIPINLHGLVDTIQPTTAFYRHLGADSSSKTAKSHVKRQESLSLSPDCDPEQFTPECFRQLYNVDYTPSANVSISVTGFLGSNASHTDAARYFAQHNSTARFLDLSLGASNTQLSETPDHNDTYYGSQEGNLDVQLPGGVMSTGSVTYIAVGPTDPSEFQDAMLNLTTYLTTSDTPPAVVSTSYGAEERFYSADYLERTCTEFMKAGARGVSVLFASGDNGVGGVSESDCSTSFYPVWPATCPWVTAVGATTFAANTTSEEVAEFDQGGSGGGFSNQFGIPDYQSADVASYLKTIPAEYAGRYNQSGRGYPDVALFGKYWEIINESQEIATQGTSLTAPLFGAMVAMLNDYRASRGQGSLGFLNPFLYSGGRGGIRDVTRGGAAGCGVIGWNASSGWDAGSGLGSVDFAKLRALV